MKLCPSHWIALDAGIAASGMQPYRARDRSHARRCAASEESQGPTADNFEPMNAALKIIAGEALLIGGLGAAAVNACPICMLGSEQWIDVAVTHARDDAAGRGLPVAQGPEPGHVGS